MNWFKLIVIAYFISSALLVVGAVGKPRERITPATGALSVVFAIVLSVLVVLA